MMTTNIAAQFGQSHHSEYDEFGPEHVSQILKSAHGKNKEIQQQRSADRKYALIRFITLAFAFVGTFVCLAVFLLPNNSDIFIDIFMAVGFFISGGLGGYGFHAYSVRKRE